MPNTLFKFFCFLSLGKQRSYDKVLRNTEIRDGFSDKDHHTRPRLCRFRAYQRKSTTKRRPSGDKRRCSRCKSKNIIYIHSKYSGKKYMFCIFVYFFIDKLTDFLMMIFFSDTSRNVSSRSNREASSNCY